MLADIRFYIYQGNMLSVMEMEDSGLMTSYALETRNPLTNARTSRGAGTTVAGSIKLALSAECPEVTLLLSPSLPKPAARYDFVYFSHGVP